MPAQATGRPCDEYDLVSQSHRNSPSRLIGPTVLPALRLLVRSEIVVSVFDGDLDLLHLVHEGREVV